MTRVFRSLAAITVAALVIGQTGAAIAQGSGQWENRADFIYQLDKALGIRPVYPATPDFQDVSPTSPYYGYIEAAYQAGITNGIASGIFGPSLGITRAEAAKYLVIAFGAGAAAAGITTTSFSDQGDIPSALLGYVGEAAALGLMKGFPDGTFQPDGNLTLTQEGYLLSHLTSAMSAITLKVTPSATDVGPGQIVTLETSGTTSSGAVVSSPAVTYSVAGANASDAVITGNSFVGSVPGSYTVQARSGSASATATVSVYGAAAGLKVNAPTSIVANGVSTAQVTVDVIDQNGNTVGDNTDQISLGTGGSTAVAGFSNGGALSSSDIEPAVNGVATFALTAGTVAGASETLTATDAALTAGTAMIQGAAQVPTSLSVTAQSPYIATNQSTGQDQISASVLDQTGNPMRSGAYTVSFSVTSGPATFAGGATAAGVYYGPAQSAATTTLDDVQGSTGPIVVTGAATGLTSGTADVSSVIAGVPAKLAISGPASTSAGTAAGYAVTIEDSNGYPAGWSGSVTVTDQNAVNLGTLTFTGQSVQTLSVTETVSGSYTLTATDAAGILTSTTEALEVNPGPFASAALTPYATQPYLDGGWEYVGTSGPNWTETVHLTDAYGNPVQQAGVEVDWRLFAWSRTGAANLGTATLNGAGETTTQRGVYSSKVVTYTNAQGVATANIAAQPYGGDGYFVTANLPAYPTIGLPGYQIGLHSSQIINVLQSPSIELLANLPTAPIDVVYKNAQSAQVSTLAAGQTYTGSFVIPDSNGNPNTAFGNLNVLLTVSGTGTVTIPNIPYSSGGAPLSLTQIGPGQYLIESHNTISNGGSAAVFQIQPGKAGPVTLTYQVVDILHAASTPTTVAVVPGSQVAQIGFSSGGTAISALAGGVTVAPGGEVPIQVTPEDAGGNPVIAASNISFAPIVEGGPAERLRSRLRPLPGHPRRAQHDDLLRQQLEQHGDVRLRHECRPDRPHGAAGGCRIERVTDVPGGDRSRSPDCGRRDQLLEQRPRNPQRTEFHHGRERHGVGHVQRPHERLGSIELRHCDPADRGPQHRRNGQRAVGTSSSEGAAPPGTVPGRAAPSARTGGCGRGSNAADGLGVSATQDIVPFGTYSIMAGIGGM